MKAWTMQMDDGLIRKQSSVWIPRQYYRGPDQAGIAGHSFAELSMFSEDVRNSIIPYRIDRSDRQVVVVAPDDRDSRRTAGKALGGTGSSHDLTHTFREFCGNLLYQWMNGENAHFEIATFENAEGVLKYFLFFRLDSLFLRQTETGIWQDVPSEYAESIRVQKHIQIPNERLVLFSRPSFMGKKFDEMLRVLAATSDMPMLQFSPSFSEATSNVPYNFKQHVQFRAIAMARATRDVGWNARLLFRESMTEYYEIARRLKFEEFLIKLRAHIVLELNRALSKATTFTGIPLSIQLQNVPTHDDVLAAERQLRGGKSSFRGVMKPFNA